MLDLHANQSDVIDAEWDAAPSKAALPASEREFFDCHGPTAIVDNSQRRFQRYFARTKGLLDADGRVHAVFVRDLSRCGIGFLSPIQLFPRQRVELQLIGGRRVKLENVRCRRLGPQAYQCGAIFVLDADR